MTSIGVLTCVELIWQTNHPCICRINLKLLHEKFFNGNRSGPDMVIKIYSLEFPFTHRAICFFPQVVFHFKSGAITYLRIYVGFLYLCQ